MGLNYWCPYSISSIEQKQHTDTTGISSCSTTTNMETVQPIQSQVIQVQQDPQLIKTLSELQRTNSQLEQTTSKLQELQEISDENNKMLKELSDSIHNAMDKFDENKTDR